MCQDMLWATLCWKMNVVGEHCVWTRIFVVVLKRTSYGLPCACFITTKIHDDNPILLDEIHRHWHRLCMSEESNEDGSSIEEEWNGVEERLKKVPYQMKLEIKEVLRQLAFLDTTMLSPPPRKVPTKGENKKVEIVRSRAKVASTTRIPFRGSVLIP